MEHILVGKAVEFILRLFLPSFKDSSKVIDISEQPNYQMSHVIAKSSSDLSSSHKFCRACTSEENLFTQNPDQLVRVSFYMHDRRIGAMYFRPLFDKS